MRSALSAAEIVIEIGCGLGLVSCAVASLWRRASGHPGDASAQVSQRRRIILCADLHGDAAAAASANVLDCVRGGVRDADGACGSDRISALSTAVDWSDDLSITRFAAECADIAASQRAEAVVVGSEVIYDEAMARHVARLFAALLSVSGCGRDGAPQPIRAGYVVVLNRRVGADLFVPACAELAVRCERFRDDELGAVVTTSCVDAAAVVFDDAAGDDLVRSVDVRSDGERLKDWSLFRLTRQ